MCQNKSRTQKRTLIRTQNRTLLVLITVPFIFENPVTARQSKLPEGYGFACTYMYTMAARLRDHEKITQKRGRNRLDPKTERKESPMHLATNDQYLADAGNHMLTADQLAGIAPGRHVRLGLDSGARFWCRVVEVRPAGYVGTVVDSLAGRPEGGQCYFDRSNLFGIV